MWFVLPLQILHYFYALNSGVVRTGHRRFSKNNQTIAILC